MKNIILTFLCIILTNDSNAQYQSLFGQNSTKWIFEWHNLGIDEQDTVYVEKDTFVFGQNWKKVLTTRWPNQFKGALIREDTSIGKVWYKGLHYINSIWRVGIVWFPCGHGTLVCTQLKRLRHDHVPGGEPCLMAHHL